MPMPTNHSSDRLLGGLYLQTGEQQLVLPQTHTEVHASIAGNLSRVQVIQKFENPFNKTLEAVYVLPLPMDATVDDMEIKMGDRLIKGIIKKRSKEQPISEQKDGSRQNSPLEQRITNIKPGDKIEITISYINSLKFERGDYKFILPLVTHTKHDNKVTLEIDAGVAISDVRSTSHQIHCEYQEKIVRVKLESIEPMPNKDLIVLYRVAGKHPQATVLTQSDCRQFYTPPESKKEKAELEFESAEEAFDISLLSPNIMQEVESDLDKLTLEALQPHLQIVSVTGLDEVAVDFLMQHLESVNLPTDLCGEIVLEFPISQNGRVGEIILDEDGSTLKNVGSIDLIKRWLSTWRAPTGITNTVRLTLHIDT